MTPTYVKADDWLLTPPCPQRPRSESRDWAELRSADGEMMATHTCGNGGTSPAAFRSPLVALALDTSRLGARRTEGLHVVMMPIGALSNPTIMAACIRAQNAASGADEL